ncbi:hypothetical protein SAICODRAFT_28737 [Saitoella complicata NRRL Y-17804]|uniref:Uncharacterized protein n=1 Tax=Saitoella complicata (strain BCRC 22490 / CBS 7301 / JCM 7358 / NBRC 10748 / NRRL Y-17804) TaxID=698492 RepID=A0A0E9N8D1_SAICN|nr:uncharacterized protein SAICODRAFT_28737 [Saitoella complicata NRRL Y-17804]ODQ55640.1 hypothetical protein SAICODRAFT_28737 [Saitoella complicata NRRL Y-17804]GAO46058.1 hypothetical protein G7K_0301-t1 [Saitoella complicata NRRL Y-17804]
MAPQYQYKWPANKLVTTIATLGIAFQLYCTYATTPIPLLEVPYRLVHEYLGQKFLDHTVLFLVISHSMEVSYAAYIAHNANVPWNVTIKYLLGVAAWGGLQLGQLKSIVKKGKAQ